MARQPSVCGIDFGTSNSALAVAQPTSKNTMPTAQLVPLEGQSTTLPSALFYPRTGTPIFGRQAVTNYLQHEEGRFMRSLKRILGTSLMSMGTQVNGKTLKFEDILAGFIKHLKSTAEAHLGTPLTSVVMGRPVHFVDGDEIGDKAAQDALLRVAQLAGFTEVLFQYEPIAAAFAHEQQIEREKLALVVDIGGGTSDFSVIRVAKSLSQKADRSDDILASCGLRIGGNDFDRDFNLHSFMPHLGYQTTYGDKKLTLPLSPFQEMAEWAKVNFHYTPRNRAEANRLLREAHKPELFERFVTLVEEELGHHLLAVVEEGKINLTSHQAYHADLGFIEAGLSVPTSQDGFNTSVRKHVEAISQDAKHCLQLAGITANQIGLVILTGGTTEVPLLRSRIQADYPHAHLSEGEKLASVGLGLGYDAARRFAA